MILLRNTRKKAVVFDFETCNLNLLPPAGTEDSIINLPWQLGWSVYNGDKLVKSNEDWLWWDCLHKKMSKDAAAITGFDYETYKAKAQDPGPVLEAFNAVLLAPEVISVTANGQNFDTYLYNILRNLLHKGTDYSWINRHVDIQVVEKAKILGYEMPPIGTHDWCLFSFKMSQIHRRGLKTNLAHLCSEYGVPYDKDRHHKEASYDSDLTYQVFRKQAQSLDLFIKSS